ncbi:MAG: type II toxin-antitoxin system VapC family toxin [Candidatus Nanopelagicales bacterium]
MSPVIDTNVFVDVLRRNSSARECLLFHLESGPIQASEVTRIELLAGMRQDEETRIRQLFDMVTWVPVSEQISELAGELGRTWGIRNQGIDLPDFVIAATAIHAQADLLTLNVKHFPMFKNLRPAY